MIAHNAASRPAPLRRAMIAEDSLLILLALEMLLEQHDVCIAAQASTVAEARALADIGNFDIAILDINLHGDMVFPVADLLCQRGIPVIFTTGYAIGELRPQRFANVPIIQKPYDAEALMVLVEQAFVCAGAPLAPSVP